MGQGTVRGIYYLPCPNGLIELTLINNQLEQIENYKTQLKNKYMELRDNEIKLAEELKEKYGEGEFDISTGIFTPKQ